jgi:hypothetical protein
MLARYVLARLAHAVVDGTIPGEIAAVEQFLRRAGCQARPPRPTTRCLLRIWRQLSRVRKN